MLGDFALTWVPVFSQRKKRMLLLASAFLIKPEIRIVLLDNNSIFK